MGLFTQELRFCPLCRNAISSKSAIILNYTVNTALYLYVSHNTFQLLVGMNVWGLGLESRLNNLNVGFIA